MEKKNVYSDTVFLPRTSFSMRGNLPKKEPEFVRRWEERGIYAKAVKKNRGNKKYLLHDGPPYANGHIHIGHALNKILKDMVVKSRWLMGFDSPYVPGWDCHGLPIEQQLLKELKIGKRHIDDVVEFRRKAREFALRFVDIQREEFRRLGVLGDWDNPYITMSPHYEGTVVRAFNLLFEKDYIFRDKKTIYWCPTCETALADAEVEYRDKTSPSVYVKFRILSPSPAFRVLLEEKKIDPSSVYLVIWTTTPWTLPANMAAAVREDESYSILETEAGHLIVAGKLAGNFTKENDLEAREVASLPGKDLISSKYEHCLSRIMPEGRNPERSVIATDFVEMETGSGIVHIAPGHGEEDFQAGKKWNLEIFCPVDHTGTFTDDAGKLSGLKVFAANGKVINFLRESGLLVGAGSLSHSYPHCWRCKQPIIFRATHQWFLGIDRGGLRKKLLDEAKKVKWIPPSGLDRMSAMLEQRPDWCLSRQRFWGTPVPVIYCAECGEPQKDPELLRAVEKRALTEGTDFWFSGDVRDMLPEGYKCGCGSEKFRKDKDILDVWLDSGVSWLAVVKNSVEMKDFHPCDLYLEGSDQHRGWFQTSLIPSVALEGNAPYKEVLTHGFVLDEKGKAMHKSLGNVVSPQEIYGKYGAEILRLWVALSNYSEDIRISDKLLAVPIDMYRKIRNTLRYILGSLSGFSPERDRMDDSELPEMERYIRHRLNELSAEVKERYSKHEYRQAIRKIADFCILDLSAFYFDAVKDALYTLDESNPERRAARTVLYDLLLYLAPMLSPVLSFTAEEAWIVARNEIDPSLSESVFLWRMPEYRKEWRDDALGEKWKRILAVRETVLKAIEDERKKGKIGASLEAKVSLRLSGTDYALLYSVRDFLAKIFIVSQAEISESEGDNSVVVSHAEGRKCPRCWQWRMDIGEDAEYGDVCGKCAGALRAKKIKI